MSIEIIKDVLRIEELKGREDTQALVESEVYLNPSKADISKLLWTDGIVEILSTKVIRDRLVISGVVKFKVVYKSAGEENNIYTVESNADFREEIEIQGITEDMSAIIKANIEYIEEDVIDERKVSLKALINLEGKVEQVNNIEIIKGIGAREGLQSLMETIRYKEIYGRETSYAIVKEAFEIGGEKPPIEEVLKMSIQAYEQESTVVEDRIIVSGVVNARIVYYGENNIATVEEEIPFNHFLEIPGAVVNAQDEISIEVVESIYEVLENSEGDSKILDIEVKLRISGLAYDENEKNLIVDAYSTKEKVKMSMEELHLIENIKSTIYRENIKKDLSEYNIKELYNISGYPSIIDSRFVDDELVVEGILAIQGIYLDAETEEINTLREEVPYKYYLPIEESTTDAYVDISLDLESIRVNMSSIEGTIKHKIKVNRNRVLTVINAMEETGEVIDERNRSSITIYIVQRNDILWDIAKRYNTTVGEILYANENINPNNIMPGEKIIIEKSVDISF